MAVQVGSVNPKGLIGFKRNKGTSRNYRTTLAWGSEFGPKGGRRKGRKTAEKVNHYGVDRNESGYWVQPTVNRNIRRVVDEYNTAIYDIWQWAISSNRVRSIRTAAGTAPVRKAA